MNGVESRRILASLILGGGIVLCQSALAQPSCTFGSDTDNVDSSIDVDDDDDGLIEICTVEGLDAIRRQLDGGGYGSSDDTTGCKTSGCNGYELTNNLDFSGTAYSENWQPIGNRTSPFSATFNGNGYTISGLTIVPISVRNDDDLYVGLFGSTGSNSDIKNIGLLNVNVSGDWQVGGLIGWNAGGKVTDSYVSGSVVGKIETGGLIGINNGVIRNSYATATITGESHTGGLVGTNGSRIFNSYATGEVKGGRNTGGLVGDINGSSASIGNSYATGDVTGTNRVGGFGGKNDGVIYNSYATGDVDGTDNVGGFIGSISGNIHNSYARGNVDGTDNVGGFIGSVSGNIHNSYATGDVDGTNRVGGFAGSISGNIHNSYARGNVDGTDYVSGFVGFGSSGNISNSYAIGVVTGKGSNIGGFRGSDAANLRDSYWDKTINGSLVNASDNSTSRTTVELQSTVIGEGIYTNWKPANWYSGAGYPLLKYTRGSNRNNPFCGTDGLPQCGSFLDGQIVAALRTLAITPVGKSTNLLDNFHYEIEDYVIRVIPDITELSFTADAFDDESVIKVNGNPIGNPFRLQFNPQNIAMAKVELELEGLVQAYNITIYNTGLCTTEDIDDDDDGLIELCWPLGLNAIRYRLDGSGYVVSTLQDAPVIVEGCNYNGNAMCRGYELRKDLDVHGIRAGETLDWTPIGDNIEPFSAIFEGNGHTISKLLINRTNLNYIGLFGYARHSTITTVGLLGINVTGGVYVGSLVGINEGEINNSYATGLMTAGNRPRSILGGLVGQNQGTIRNSYANVTVGGSVRHELLGGLVGQNQGTISNSYAIGAVTGGNTIGGFVGFGSSGNISNSYAIGAVTGNLNVGGFAGTSISGINDSYWDKFTSGQTVNIVGGNAKTTVELQSTAIGEGIYENWSAENWFAGSGGDYPVLRYVEASDTSPACGKSHQPMCGSLLSEQRIFALKTLTISEAGEATNLLPDFVPGITTYTVIITPDVTRLSLTLEPFSDDVTIKINDSEITSTKTEVEISPETDVISIALETTEGMHTYAIAVLRAGLCNVENIDQNKNGLIEICWPIGLNAIRYRLDGSGYKVGADANAPIITAGCAVRCRGYELMKDLSFSESAEDWVPIGDNNNPFTAIFTGNNHTVADLTITATTDYTGLFGYARDSVITSIGLLNADINGKAYVGGVVGVNEGFIGNSYITGNLSGDNSVGGFVGANRGAIFNSYAQVSVSGRRDVGGFIGNAEGTIGNSYTFGSVTGIRNVGGFVGLQSTGTIENAYATSSVTGDNYVGGFVGRQRGGEIRHAYSTGAVIGSGSNVGGFSGLSSNIIVSHWDRERSGITISSGGTSKTSVELKESEIGKQGGIYATWSTNDWYSGTSNDYPILKYSRGNSVANPLCGSKGLPTCDAVLAGQFPPLSSLTLQSGTEKSVQFNDEILSPSFDYEIFEYDTTIYPVATHIQLVLTSPTTRNVSYRIDDGDFSDTRYSVTAEPSMIPLSPIPLGSEKTTKITIKVFLSETESDQDTVLYTVIIRRPAVSIWLKVLLEGMLQQP